MRMPAYNCTHRIRSAHHRHASFKFIAWFLFILVIAQMMEMTASLGVAESSLLTDKQALLDIKNSLQTQHNNSQEFLDDWLQSSNNSSPCHWTRVSCTVVPSINQIRVTQVDLSSLSIHSKLPSALSNLFFLSNFNISQNKFYGYLSPLSNSTYLTHLDLSTNNFSNIAASDDDPVLTKLNNLQFLSLANNSIGMPISSVLPLNCTNLKLLNLSHNLFKSDFSQSYPWQSCLNLKILDLSSNMLTGPMPEGLPKLQSVIHLTLSNNSLTGNLPISPCSYANYSKALLYLDLSLNNFTGTIPHLLSNCTALRYLDLSSNKLVGDIPSEIGYMSSLVTLNLGQNSLTGPLPPELGNLANLKILMAGNNHLNGSIPSKLNKCMNLTMIDLDTNFLQGSIPDFLGEMTTIQCLVLHSNAFSGSLPSSLFNPLSQLTLLDLSNNSLSGTIPDGIANLTSLRYLMLAQNKLSGQIPSTVGSISNLQFLDLSSNNLSGHIPTSLGKLQHLLWLMLAFNNLSGEIPAELGNCTSLLWLNLKKNSLTGAIPTQLAMMGQDPSKTFELNSQTDSLNAPKGLGECSVLRRWVVEDYPPYSFVYTILDNQSCRSFWLVLLRNSPLRSSCNSGPAVKGYIQLTGNKLTGKIPNHLQGNRTTFLLLGYNMFTSLPDSFGNLPLVSLNVSNNIINGFIPSSLGKENKCLSILDLSKNNLSGPIPSSLGDLDQLSQFNVSYNPYLNGTIPWSGQFLSFGKNSYLNDALLCLDVPAGSQNPKSSNSTDLPLCGVTVSPISAETSTTHQKKMLKPVYLILLGILSFLTVVSVSALVFHQVFNLSERDHEEDNSEYSSTSTKLNPGDTSKSAVKVFRSVNNVAEVSNGVITDDTINENTNTNTHQRSNTESSMTKLIVTDNRNEKEVLYDECCAAADEMQVTYGEILLATDNFSKMKLIGSGGYGTVYKAKLKNGATVAIKRLMNVKGKTSQKEFLAEMETLGMLNHENLVPLIACCSCGSERLIVYKLICNGSLEDWLHGNLDQDLHGFNRWDTKLKIALGCARALGYLHNPSAHDNIGVIVHRDMKPSNVLLDEAFNPYLCDFGLAREVMPNQTHVSTTLAGTLGYLPPEYGQVWRANPLGDVYSFGVVLLELITGRKPFEPPPSSSANTLIDWIRSTSSQVSLPSIASLLKSCGSCSCSTFTLVNSLPENLVIVNELNISPPLHLNILFPLISIALACTNDIPHRRPSMAQIVILLEHLLLSLPT